MLNNLNWNKPVNPVRDILLRAADLMEKYGHAKFTRIDENGSMCFLGALQAAENNGDVHWFTPDTPLSLKASEALVRAVGITPTRHEHRDARHCAADWNNSPEITGKDVIAAMRLAADQVLLDEQETVDAV